MTIARMDIILQPSPDGGSMIGLALGLLESSFASGHGDHNSGRIFETKV